MLAAAVVAVIVGLAGPAAAGGRSVPAPEAVSAGAAGPEGGPFVEVVEVTGLVDRLVEGHIRRRLAAADEGGAMAVVLQVNSPGDVLGDRELAELVRAVGEAPVPVVAWVGPSGARAGGGAARLVAAADLVAVAPGSHLDGPDGRRLGAEEAVEAGVADLVAPTLSGLVVLELDDRVVGGVRLDTATVESDADGTRIQQTVEIRFHKLPLVDQLAHTVASPPLAWLLLLAGLGLLVFELYAGGVGVAGVTGAAALLAAGYGLDVLGVRGWALGLVVLAFVGFAIDVQAGAPRTWTVIATVSLIVGSVSIYDGMTVGWVALPAGVVGTFLLMVVALPAVVRSRFSTPTIGRDWLVGRTGTAVVDVAPRGVVRVAEAEWRAVTNRATPISAGSPVRVVAIDGISLEVEPLEGAARDPSRRPR